MRDDIVLDQIRGDAIAEAWPFLEPWFASACRRVPTHLTPELILYRATTKQSDLWACYRKAKPLPLLAAASTCLRDGPNGQVCTIECLGGHDVTKWGRRLLEEFEALARQNGVAEIEIEGRLGWARYLSDYERRRIVLGKRLT